MLYSIAHTHANFCVDFCASVVFYRCADFAYRLNNFYTWLSNVSPLANQLLDMTTVTLCRQYSGSLAAGASVLVTCPSSLPVFRYVIIQSSLVNDVLSLAEVAVYTG